MIYSSNKIENSFDFIFINIINFFSGTCCPKILFIFIIITKGQFLDKNRNHLVISVTFAMKPFLIIILSLTKIYNAIKPNI